ncbi:protein Spindly isoform X6 [Syngnathus scovelli]|uniref:protein Spindly isoform X6 n=1 Tax=Syngnathus scovelli TaxID=161590 RepID=UPI00210F5057|nr:protein Spindly isoform X6 [Syngnathus scovelli]
MSDTAREDEIQFLRDQLRQKEEEVQLAAHAGLDLLNQLTETQTLFEEQRIKMTSALEGFGGVLSLFQLGLLNQDFKQDKYTLQKEVVLKTRLIESLQSEVDCLTKWHRQNMNIEKEKLESSHRTTLNELNNKVIHLQSALDESQLIQKQLKEKLDLQTKVLNNKMDEIRFLNEDTQSSCTSEFLDLQKNVLELEDIKLELELALKESKYKEHQLELTNRGLQHNLKQTTEEKNNEAATCSHEVLEKNGADKSREVNCELQVHMERVLQQAQDPNSKGNSLFAELEDERAEMERRLISMKDQYESLQAHYAFNKQQLQRMKVLLKTKESNAPASEIGTGEDETFYTVLLKMKLDNAIKDVERLGDELSMQRMQSLLESQKVLELEKKLFKDERLLKQAQCDKISLQLQVEELKHKYEPKETTDLSQGTKKEKLPTHTVPSFEGTTHGNSKQISKEKVITHTMILLPETDKCRTGFDVQLKSVNHVNINGDDPVLTANTRYLWHHADDTSMIFSTKPPRSSKLLFGKLHASLFQITLAKLLFVKLHATLFQIIDTNTPSSSPSQQNGPFKPYVRAGSKASSDAAPVLIHKNLCPYISTS